mmetsp:Transcript_1861/g.3985  ORF Transcript_1861/g.3985 Transcript_1861/m.3985 type:complete len:282 (-) Transcript_1861:1306-2151(-)
MHSTRDLILLEVFCGALCLVYIVSMYFSIKNQVKHFNQNRFLEMAYYVISFFILARIVFCIIYATTDNLTSIIVSEFAPDVFCVTICSMLTYFWHTVIWNLRDVDYKVKLRTSKIYAVMNLVLIAVHYIVQAIVFVVMSYKNAILVCLVLASCQNIINIVHLPYRCYMFLRSIDDIRINTRELKRQSLLTAFIIVISCFYRLIFCLTSFSILVCCISEQDMFIIKYESLEYASLFLFFQVLSDVLPINAVIFMLRRLDLSVGSLYLRQEMAETYLVGENLN